MLLLSFILQCKGFPGDCVSVVRLIGVLFGLMLCGRMVMGLDGING